MFYLILIATSADMSVQKAMMCTSQLEIGVSSGRDPSGSMNNKDTEDILIRACRNGNLLTAIKCIEAVLDECEEENSDVFLVLKMMVDIKKARKSVDYFCNNLHVYTDNAECIGHHHNELVGCTQEAMNSYQRQARAANSTEILIQAQCVFYRTMVTCVRTVLEDKCSKEAADILTTVLEGFGPPNCISTSSSLADTERTHTNEQHSNHNMASSNQLSICYCLLVIATVTLA